jgi:hypothetical protein
MTLGIINELRGFFSRKKSRALFAAAAPERGAKALGHSDGAGLLIPQA